MPGYSPIQKAFNAGEISRRFSGQTDSPLYQRGLEFCENFIPTPQGSLLMTAGSQKVHDLAAEKPRLIPFRVSGAANDHIIALTDGKLRVFSRDTGALIPIRVPVKTSHFDADLDGWTAGGAGGAAVWADEHVYFPANGAFIQRENFPALTVGVSYTITFRIKASATKAEALVVIIEPNGGGVSDLTELIDVTGGYAVKTVTFVAARTDPRVVLMRGVAADMNISVDWVALTRDDAATVTELVSPYSEAQLPAIQYDSEPTRNRAVLVHANVAPQAISVIADDIWEIRTIGFAAQPGEWGPDNWPTVVEVGFQGRSWFGATPNAPHTVWYSKSGAAFNFTTGVNADDSSSFIVSTKGAIRWLRGQKRLFAGAETIEHSASGGDTIISPGNVKVEDQSAFGSGPVQGLHIGDQVLWVNRALRAVRAMNYVQDEDSWLSTPVNLYADHIIPASGIAELHFARDPFPIIFVVCVDGSLRACTYDRAAKTIAWFRLDMEDSVVSGAVSEGPYGAEFWFCAYRGAKYVIERLPLHEVAVQYLHSWVTATKASASSLTGMSHLANGTLVRVVMDGVVLPGTYAVAGGAVASDGLFDGDAFVVGIPYTARAVTLPLEGGDPTGTSQGKAIHWSEIVARLNNSARPLLNGERAGLGKPFGPSLDTLETLLTKDVRAGSLEVAEGGQVTITQDQPYRTEICGLFGQAEVTRV